MSEFGNRYLKAARAVMGAVLPGVSNVEPKPSPPTSRRPQSRAGGPDDTLSQSRTAKDQKLDVSVTQRGAKSGDGKPKMTGPRAPTYFEQTDEFGNVPEGPREATDPVAIDRNRRDKMFNYLKSQRKPNGEAHFSPDVIREMSDRYDFNATKNMSEDELDGYHNKLLYEIRSELGFG